MNGGIEKQTAGVRVNPGVLAKETGVVLLAMLD
jgi:hypothetical protein